MSTFDITPEMNWLPRYLNEDGKPNDRLILSEAFSLLLKFVEDLNKEISPELAKQGENVIRMLSGLDEQGYKEALIVLLSHPGLGESFVQILDEHFLVQEMTKP